MPTTLRKIAEMTASHPRSRTPWRTSLLLAAFACAILLCSCEPELSVHKLYASDDVVFEPSLLGTWTMPPSPGTEEVAQFQFSNGVRDGYTITMTYQEYPGAKTESYCFSAQLVKLHGRLFIDVVPTSSRVNDQDSDGPAGIPGHFFGRISIAGDVLKMSFLDDDWVANHIKARDIYIDSEEEGEKSVVLTAPTADLQKLVIDHADDDQAFSVVLDDLNRKSSGPTSGSN